MTTTPETPRQNGTSYERLIRHLVAQLRQDAGDYAKVAQGVPMSHELSWDARDVRAWDAATALEALLTRDAGLLVDAPTEEQVEPGRLLDIFEDHYLVNRDDPEFDMRALLNGLVAVAAAGVAPQEPSLVASAPTVGDDGGHGGDDDRGGREDGPEDEGCSHQATVAGTSQRPSGCAECYRAEGHKMDCSLRAIPTEPSECSNPQCPLQRAHSGPCAAEGWSPDRAMQIARELAKAHTLTAVDALSFANAALALAAPPALDPEKVAKVVHDALPDDNSAGEYTDFGRCKHGPDSACVTIARALCEAAERGELS